MLHFFFYFLEMLQDFKLSKLIPGFNRRHVVMLGARFIYLACASYWVCDGNLCFPNTFMCAVH